MPALVSDQGGALISIVFSYSSSSAALKDGAK